MSFCQPQQINGKIIFTDTLIYYGPGASALTIFLNQGNSVIQATIPDSKGQFVFRNINRGLYSLVIKEISRRKDFLADSSVIVADKTLDLSITYPPPCTFVYIKGQKAACPRDHSDKIIPIVYGLPTNKTMEKAKNGFVRLGGCIVSDCDPRYYCTIHKIEF